MHRINYTIEGESNTITVITDRQPEAGEKVHIRRRLVRAAWQCCQGGIVPHFTVASVETNGAAHDVTVRI